ncbi:ribonuclease HII [Weizmannia acidilactici]|uniref:Ribonuclease HII n=1 Tax=Weizmannia acidilactici TaxID=2607726 RepID=A0A5J4JJ64_9BACI|nr:ribonuclease HII [Weizmannia acidilactici]GER69064.1 ribonuclease HII [Weizmannia acidilactici]
MKVKISEIEERLAVVKDPDNPFILALQKDGRKGAQEALEKWKRKLEKEHQALEKFREMMRYENALRLEGHRLIAGIDEAGRGPLAGPVVAAAVILPEDFYLAGLNDSKQLSGKQREKYYSAICEKAGYIGVGIVDADEIDKINIYKAAKKAMMLAVENLLEKPDHLLIDAMEIPAPYPQTSIIKGDAKSVSIAAASIIAKVTRDRLMQEMDKKYPEYGFAKNMGYGTKEHLEALKRHGPCPIHRKTFAPVKNWPAF